MTQSVRLGVLAFIIGIVNLAAIGGLAWVQLHFPQYNHLLPYPMVGLFVLMAGIMFWLHRRYANIRATERHDDEDWTREKRLQKATMYKKFALAAVLIAVTVTLENISPVAGFTLISMAVLVFGLGLFQGMPCPACRELPPLDGTGSVSADHEFCSRCGARLNPPS